MLANFCIAFLFSLCFTYVLIKYQHLHDKHSHDHDLKGVQKFHIESVPRIGGLALVLALVVAGSPLWLILSSLPVFLVD